MLSFKRVFSSSPIIKPTNINRFIEKTEPINVVIKKFVSKPAYTTQLEIYSTCYNYSRKQPTKIILSGDLYDSFKLAINNFGKEKFVTRILDELYLAIITITSITLSQPIDKITAFLFMVILVAEYKTLAMLSKMDIEIHHRQQFLQDFFSNKIVRCAVCENIHIQINDTR